MEIAIGDDVDFDAPAVRRASQAAGMQLTLGPGALWPMDCDISHDDPAKRKLGLDWHSRWIDTAADAGAIAYTGAIYGHPGQVLRRRPPADEFKRTAENLHILAERASRGGLKLVIEPMSHFRTHLVNTPEQLMRLVELADHPNLLVLLDTYHMATEVRDYAAAVRYVAPKLWGIHACENDRGVPGGGLIPWTSFIPAVKHANPDSYIFFESYNSSLGDFALNRSMFHDVCPDGDAFVRQGIGFLKRLWQQAASS
jgi:D-psicose/D-tagatose/L-ribulose 3-epimerase